MNKKIKSKLSSIRWHDCELLNLTFSPQVQNRTCSIVIEINPIIKIIEKEIHREKKVISFENCQFFATSLDIDYLLACQMNLDDAHFYTNSSELDNENKKLIFEMYGANRNSKLAKEMIFYLEMAAPGGEIIIFARDFNVLKEVKHGKPTAT